MIKFQKIQLFQINPQIFNRKSYINGTDDNAKALWSYLLNWNYQICGFASDEDSGMKMFGKDVLSVNEVREVNGLRLVNPYWSNDRNDSDELIEKAFILNPKISKNKIVLYGAGEIGIRTARFFRRLGIDVECFIDSNVNKVGSELDGISIKPLSFLEKNIERKCIVITALKAEEIYDLLVETGISLNHDIFIENHLWNQEYPIVWELTDKQYSHLCLNDVINICSILRDRRVFVYGDTEKTISIIGLIEAIGIPIHGCVVSGINQKKINEKYTTKSIYQVTFEENDYVILPNIDLSVTKVLEEKGLKRYTGYERLDHISNELTPHREAVFDVNLGYSYYGNGEYPGIDILGDIMSNYPIVAVLGDSTTDESLFSFKSWVKYLWELCERRITIINGGMTGYTSSHEIIKFIRDILTFHPSKLIVYGGFTDAVCHGLNSEGFEMGYLNYVFDKYAKYIEKEGQEKKQVWRGIRHLSNCFQEWLKNMELLYGMCKVCGIDFIAIMQPMLGSKKKRDIIEEGLWKQSMHSSAVKDNILEMRNAISKIENDYIYDFSDIFDSINDVYIDEIHVNEKGNEIIAKKVYKYFFKDN